MQWVWVDPWSGSFMAKKTKTQKNRSNIVTNSIKTLKMAHVKKKNVYQKKLLKIYTKKSATDWL